MDQPFQIMPCFSLEPTKLTLYNRVFRNSDYDENGNKRDKVKRLDLAGSEKSPIAKPLKRQSHNLLLSDNAYRTLRKRISWLYYLSKSRYRKTYNGKEIYNFKICFLTLTLSSEQRTSTADVTNKMFNQFLTELRQRTGMENYVWRMEYQRNGNVHYHLVTDTYLDYYFVLPIWNRIQDLNGYIKPYQEKMRQMSLSDYNRIYNTSGKKEFSVMAKQYAKGKSKDWSQPNSVDLKSVISKKAIGAYISKYFGKNEQKAQKANAHDTPENVANIRLWFCSRSLSKVNNYSDFCEASDFDITAVIEAAKDVKKYFAEYATILYFEITNLPNYCRQLIEPLLRNHAYATGYAPSQ